MYDGLQRLTLKGMILTSRQPTGGQGRPRKKFVLCFPSSDRGPPFS